MRFAVLGDDGDVRALERAVAHGPQHEFTRVPTGDWETLLIRTEYDAVIVARDANELLHFDQLKKLVGTGVPVVASHPTADVLTAYELEMVRRESKSLLIPFAREWNHPAWSRLSEFIAGSDSPVGILEQISFERHLTDRNRVAVQVQVAQDVELIRRFVGTITSVNAVGMSRDQHSWNSLTIHFTGESGCSATWSLTVPGNSGQTTVQLVGERGTATLTIPDDSLRNWELRESGGSVETFDDWNVVTALVDQVNSERAGRSTAPTWEDACLDLEVADTAEKSLRRKRAIDLYTADRSEEKTFKGFMSAAGCLVLVVILLGFFGFAIWDGIRAPFREAASSTDLQSVRDGVRDSEPGWPLWLRLWPVYPLVGFLILQFLLVIARPSATEKR